MEAYIMKKLNTKRTHMKYLLFTLALTGALSMTPVALKAQVHEGETEQEHKILAGTVAEFAEYGAALKAFNDNFFGVTPNKFTKVQFINLAQKLHTMIAGIQERTVKYRTAVTGQDSTVILTELEKLATLLAASGQKLLETLQKSLGTKTLLVSLKRLSDAESKNIKPVQILQKGIGSLLAKHSTKEVQAQFAQFVNNVTYSLDFPGKNVAKVLSIAMKYSSLK
jgi:hypothetical protein